MHICNKCGKETFNSDMICDNCKTKKEIKQVLQTKEKDHKQKSKDISRDGPENGNQDELRKTMNNNLMFCPDCGNKISRNALQCPHCGCPFEKKEEKKEEKEKVLLKDNGVKAVSYITTVFGYFLSSVVFGIGCLIPLCWLIYLCVYVSGKDGNKYDMSWYIKLRNEFIILTILGLPIIIFL